MYSDYSHQNLGGNKTIPFYFSILQTIYRRRQGCESLLRFLRSPSFCGMWFFKPGGRSSVLDRVATCVWAQKRNRASPLVPPDRSLQPGDVPERAAAGPGHGHGWIRKPPSAAALPLHAQEDGRGDELRVPPGSPHGPGAALSGRRKVTCHFQRCFLFLLSPLLQKLEQRAVYLIFIIVFDNIQIH